jgi:hypothetical protein
MENEKLTVTDKNLAGIARPSGGAEPLHVSGRYVARCYGRCGRMTLKWIDHIDNVVTTAGKNALLQNALSGSAYTAATYMGLISSVGYASVPVVADTLASHATWAEAGSGANYPIFAARVAPPWGAAAAGAKALSTPASFSIITTGGTVKGAFIAFNGASATIGNTSGTLYSAGLFSGGDKVLQVGDTLQVSYSTTLT